MDFEPILPSPPLLTDFRGSHPVQTPQPPPRWLAVLASLLFPSCQSCPLARATPTRIVPVRCLRLKAREQQQACFEENSVQHLCLPCRVRTRVGAGCRCRSWVGDNHYRRKTRIPCTHMSKLRLNMIFGIRMLMLKVEHDIRILRPGIRPDIKVSIHQVGGNHYLRKNRIPCTHMLKVWLGRISGILISMPGIRPDIKVSIHQVGGNHY